MKPFDAVHQDLNGFQVIEASAGCGKTYAIITLFLRLLAESGFEVEEILVVTFTDAAASELKDRVRKRIKEMLDALNQTELSDLLARHFAASGRDAAVRALLAALQKLDRASISTIHGFCRQVLVEQAFESGVSFDTALVTNKDALFEEIACDFFARSVAAADSLFIEFLESRKFNPQSLVSILKTISGETHMRILPDAANVPNSSELFLSAFAKARDILDTDRAAVERLFLTFPGLNHRSYTKKNVPKWLDTLQRFFSASYPSLSLLEAAKRFSSAGLAEKMEIGSNPPEHGFIQAMDEMLAAEQGFENMLIQLKRSFVDEARITSARIKKEREIHTFDDLVQSLHSALSGPVKDTLIQTLRSKYKAVLIDEFQDTDRIQFDIFNQMFGGTGTPFFVIGDPKQSIYAFRGGDIYTYLHAVRAAGDSRFTLDTNHRSDPSLIRAVSTVFSRRDNPFLFEEIGFVPVSSRPNAADTFPVDTFQGALEIRFVSRADAGMDNGDLIPMELAGQELPAWIASDIRNLICSKDRMGQPVTPSRIAVLVRTNTHAQEIREALREKGVPAVLFRESSVFHTEEAEELRLLLRAVHEPADLIALRTLLSTRLIGMKASQLNALSEDPASLDMWIDRLSTLRRLLSQGGSFKMFQTLLALESDRIPLGVRLLSRPDGERAMTNYRHLMELIERQMSGSGWSGTGLIQWLDRQCAEAKEGAVPTDETELRLMSDEDSVRVLTMHKSKGLEFDIVYCPHLWIGNDGRRRDDGGLIFHDSKKNDVWTADLSSDPANDHVLQAKFERRAESIRLAYVALTRAKQRCIVIHGAFKSMGDSPAAHLFHRSDKVRVEEMSDEDLLSDLRALEETSGGTIHVSLLTQIASENPAERADTALPTLSARVLKSHIPAPCITTSFTGMTADNIIEGAPLRIDAAARNEPALLHFDRGSRAGTCLHAIFERIDFENPDKETVSEILHDFGYSDEWKDPLFRDLNTILKMPLSDFDPDTALCHISNDRRLNELAFLFPMEASSSFTQILGSLFAKQCTACAPNYPDALYRMGLGTFRGFMRGFIDLIFEYRGKYYIADYKSNFLGERPEDYHLDAMSRAMAEHHYFLQYHIYAVALHRHLGVRLSGYDFESHFGGVYYLFLRGMLQDSSRRLGVFFDRPSADMIEGMSALFSGKPLSLPPVMTREAPAPSAPVTVAPRDPSVQLILPGFSMLDESPKKKRKGIEVDDG